MARFPSSLGLRCTLTSVRTSVRCRGVFSVSGLRPLVVFVVFDCSDCFVGCFDGLLWLLSSFCLVSWHATQFAGFLGEHLSF